MSEATTPVRDGSHASLIGPRVNCSRRTPQPCSPILTPSAPKINPPLSASWASANMRPATRCQAPSAGVSRAQKGVLASRGLANSSSRTRKDRPEWRACGLEGPPYPCERVGGLKVGSIGIRAMLSQAIGAPARSAACPGGKV